MLSIHDIEVTESDNSVRVVVNMHDGTKVILDKKGDDWIPESNCDNLQLIIPVVNTFMRYAGLVST